MSFRTAKLELQTYVPELNPLQCGMRLNRSYQRLLDLHQWAFLKREALINTVAGHNTGTITATEGSTTVTGSGTAFTAAMTGRFIKFQGHYEYYKISSINVGLQTMELDQVSGYSVADGGYYLFQHQYAKPTNCKFIINIKRQLSLAEKTKEWIDAMDPDRDGTGEPIYYCNYNDTTIELWPVPDQIYVVRVGFILLVADMVAEADVPLLPESLIITHAALQAYRQLASNSEKAQAYLRLYQVAKDEFQEAWRAAFEADLKKQSLPDRVRIQGEDVTISGDFWLARDDFWAGFP